MALPRGLRSQLEEGAGWLISIIAGNHGNQEATVRNIATPQQHITFEGIMFL